MSVPMKARRTKREIPIQVGDRRPRLFLVPKDQAEGLVRLLKNFEVGEIDSLSARAPVQDLLDAYTEPGVALRGARAKAGLSQGGLAAKLSVAASNISEMEHGRRPIGKKMAQRLARVLGVGYRIFL